MLKILYAPHTSAKRQALATLLQDLSGTCERVFVVVPEQQVLETEGFLCSLTGIEQYRYEAASFRRIANSIFRKYGGLRYHYIGKGAKQILMWRTLLSLTDTLKTLGGVMAEDMTKPRLLLDTVEELKHFGVTPEMLDGAAEKTDDEHLAAKLNDLSLLYSAYETLLHEDHDDAADDVARATKLAQGRGFFKNAHIIVDSFDGFTVYELALLSLMMEESAGVTVTLAYEKDDMRKIFLKLKDTDRRLRALAENASIPVEEAHIGGGSDNPAVRYFSDNIWRSRKEKRPEALSYEAGYRMLKCGSIYEEAAFVAADIAKRVQAGARYRDFAVITRDTSRYNGVLDAALEGADIPYFLSVRKDAMAIPLVRMLFTALDIHCYGFRTEDVIAYMRSGLSGLSLEECDVLEEYATVWHISGRRWYDDAPWQMNPGGFSLTFDDKAREQLADINELRAKLIRPLTAFFEAFSHAPTVRSVSEALVLFLRAVGIAELLEKESERSRALFAGATDREEHILFYDQLITLLDQLVDVAGDVTVSSREYSRLLYTILSEADIGKLPSRMDQVTVGNADLIRKTDSRYVYVIGLCQGVFPQPTGNNGCFDSEEKEKLSLLGIETSPDGVRRLADEKLYYYRALTSASVMTTLTYTFRTEDGKEAFPSSALIDTCALFGVDIKNLQSYASIPVGEKLYGTSEILEYAVNHGYTLQGYGDALRGRYALTQSLAASEDFIPEAIASARTGKVIRLSQSQMDKFVLCPFRYHCSYSLHLSEPKNGNMQSVDVGSYIHKVLELFVLAVRDRIKTITDEEAFAILDGIIDDYVARIFRGNQNKRMTYLLKRLRGTTRILVKSVLEECRVSLFTPRFFELAIGGAREKDGGADDEKQAVRSEVIDIGDGKKVTVRGEVDRVDVYTEGNKTYIRVVDYKTGSKVFSMKDIELGLNLQMLLYLFALCSDVNGDFHKLLDTEQEVEGAGVLYLSLASKTVNSKEKPKNEEDADNMMANNVMRSGLLIEDEALLSAMEAGLAGKFIPVTYAVDKKTKETKLKATKGVTLCSLAEMGALAAKVRNTVVTIAKEMNKGKGKAKPLNDSAHNACKYCPMKPVCRTPECLGGNSDDNDEKGAEA